MFSFINHLRWLFSPQDKRKFIFIAMLMAFSAILELAGIGILLGATTVFLASDTPAGIKAAQILSFCMPGIAAKYQVAWAIIAIGLLLMLKNLFALLVINIQAKFIFAKRNELAKRLFKGLFADIFAYLSQSFLLCPMTFIVSDGVKNPPHISKHQSDVWLTIVNANSRFNPASTSA